MGPLVVATATGGVKSAVMVVLLLTVLQPLPGFVTVTRYNPAAETTGFCEVEVKPNGPVQEKVTPTGKKVPVIARVGWIQLIKPPTGNTTGLAVSATTMALAVLIQVVMVSATLNTNVPTADTCGVKLFDM